MLQDDAAGSVDGGVARDHVRAALLLCAQAVLTTVVAAFDRRLLLNKDEMVLPTGLLQRGAARIAYASIEGVWRHYLPATVVLRVATEKCIFEIVSVLLPDNESFYRALEEFLNLKAQENAANKGISKSQLT